MNEIDKQEINESEPEQAAPTESRSGSDSTQPSTKGPMKLAILALILAVGGSGLVYLQLSDLNDALQQEQQALEKLKKQQQETTGRQDKSDRAISAQQTAFNQQDEQLRQQTEEMKQSLDLVYERVGRSSTQWLVAEAEYLMRIANHRLQLEEDSHTALVALERADKRLRDSGDPVWTPVREKLASEMIELKGLKELDLAGQNAKLSGLITQVEKLNLPHSISVASATPAEGAKEEKEFSMDAVLKDFWQGLKSLLKVRRHDRPVTAMLEPDQTFFLYQNLRLQLEGARLALLRRDQALFDSSLQRVEAWIKEFFDQEQALTQSMLEGIKQLKGLKLAAKMPDISGSLRMLLEQQGQVYEEGEPEDQQQLEQNEGQTQVEEEVEQSVEPQVDAGTAQPDQDQNRPDQGQGEANTEQKVAP